MSDPHRGEVGTLSGALVASGDVVGSNLVKRWPDGVVVRRGSQWWIEAYHNVDVKRSAHP